MAYQVIYKKRFLNKLDKLLDYLQKEWTESIAFAFLETLLQQLESVSQYPGIGKTTAYENVRTIRITKHNRIYYRIEKNKIVILNMIDPRKDPRKNPFKKTK